MLSFAKKNVDCFAGHIVVSGREGGFTGVWVLDAGTLAKHKITFDEPIYTAELDVNREFGATQLRFEYSSLTTPRSIFEYDMAAAAHPRRRRCTRPAR